jgi:sugar phosphate isomerase/epimerase
MRISISNIAWEPAEDAVVAERLRARGIDAIDVAPSRYFADVADVAAADLTSVRAAWRARGCDIVGMQSLLYGTSGLNLFGEQDVRERMLGHLDAICRIGAGLGATRLVFGSPSNRNRSGLSDAEAHAIAIDFFRALGDIAAGHAATICLEPNPTAYGANFMTSSGETAAIVEAVGHAAIRMQLDLGAVAMNGESLHDVLDRCGPLIGHVHLSEPHLRPLQDMDAHRRSAAALRAAFGDACIVTIEMRRDAADPLGAVERSLQLAQACYG